MSRCTHQCHYVPENIYHNYYIFTTVNYLLLIVNYLLFINIKEHMHMYIFTEQSQVKKDDTDILVHPVLPDAEHVPRR